ETARRARRFYSMAGEIPAASGDNVDDREERVVAVQRRTGSADDLDAVDQIHVENEIGRVECAVVRRLIQPVTVHQNEDAAAEVTRPVEPADADVSVVAVVGDVETPDAAQNIRQRA